MADSTNHVIGVPTGHYVTQPAPTPPEPAPEERVIKRGPPLWPRYDPKTGTFEGGRTPFGVEPPTTTTED